MKVTEMFKRKNGQLLCDHNMDYKLDPAFMKWINYVESRKQLGMRIGIPFSVADNKWDTEIDGKWFLSEHETGIDGQLVLNYS